MKKLILGTLLLLLPIICFTQVRYPISNTAHLVSGAEALLDDGNTWLELEAKSADISFYGGTVDTVQTWNDISGNGRHMGAFDNTRGPRFLGDSVFFDGVNDYLFYGSDTIDQPFTIYIVSTIHTHINYGALWDADDNNHTEMILDDRGDGTLRMGAGTYIDVDDTLTIGTQFLMTAIYNGASSKVRINNDSEVTENPNTNNMEGFQLGSRYTFGYYNDYSVRYVIVRQGADSADDQNTIRAWLNGKYSIY